MKKVQFFSWEHTFIFPFSMRKRREKEKNVHAEPIQTSETKQFTPQEEMGVFFIDNQGKEQYYFLMT